MGLKICLVTPSFPPAQWGGLARTAGRVADHAAEMGLEVHVACLRPAAGPDAWRLDRNRTTSNDGRLWVHRIDVPPTQPDAARRQPWDGAAGQTLRAMALSLEKLGREHGFDLFHSFFVFPLGHVAGLTAARLGRPHLATVVGDDLNRFVHDPDKIAPLRLTLATARAVVCLSDDLLQLAGHLQDLTGRGRVILNGVDIPDLAWPGPRPGRPWRLGCAGKMKYSKGLPYLLAAWNSLPAGGPGELEIRGRITDDPGDQSARGEAVAAGPVLQRPPLPPEDMPAWLADLDAFVLPSISEGCPNVLMEAMAMGLPCVATRVGAVPELVEDGVSGLLVAWGEPGPLAAALARLRDDDNLAASLGRAARERMRLFSPARERAQWQTLYRQILD